MDILSMSLDEVTAAFKENSIQAFRAKQVYEWLHKHLVQSYDEMTNLPKDLRAKLTADFPVEGCKVEKVQTASDGTLKFLYSLKDDELVESVVMKYKYGYTVCVSSQVGCKMGCRFCASTVGGFRRNLTPGEMLDQVYRAQSYVGERISHIVLMGMGEPMNNFDNVMKFISLLTDENGINLSVRNISLSTCGIVPGIEKLREKHLQLTLSVSLHAPNDKIRNGIMPVNKKYGVDELLSACRRYASETSRRISFEYSMMKDVNDSDECAKELASKLKGMLCHVNLIPINEVETSPFRPSTQERISRFSEILSGSGISTTVRRKLGYDIDASCGQLRLKSIRERGNPDASCS
ncbi:MAG: 23S rRNA (adenine(2503)-C(2))-methyltransferase RlmN [Clostridia bacterium]|nr:23S rRNA (adenine(2503)-C(2))-methyltransferase RlmN [Clostridia bacterium]